MSVPIVLTGPYTDWKSQPKRIIITKCNGFCSRHKDSRLCSRKQKFFPTQKSSRFDFFCLLEEEFANFFMPQAGIAKCSVNRGDSITNEAVNKRQGRNHRSTRTADSKITGKTQLSLSASFIGTPSTPCNPIRHRPSTMAFRIESPKPLGIITNRIIKRVTHFYPTPRILSYLIVFTL